MTPAARALTLQGVSKTFRPPHGPPVAALRSVDLTLRSGDFVVVVGHNGSGKTTLLNVIAGTVVHDAGSVTLHADHDIDWNSTPAWERAAHLGRVYQNPTENVVSDLSVTENLALARLATGRPSPLRRAVHGDAAAGNAGVLAEIDLAGRERARATDLSFGQQQLLALQLALLRNPALLLLDEPTAALDRRNAAQCLEFLQRRWRDSGRMIMMVTHDLGVALRTGNRLLVLREGAVAADLDAAAKSALGVEPLFELCGFGTTSPGS